MEETLMRVYSCVLLLTFAAGAPAAEAAPKTKYGVS